MQRRDIVCIFRLIAVLALLLSVGCDGDSLGSASDALVQFPELPESSVQLPGARMLEVDLGVAATDAGHDDRLLVYLPDPMPKGPLPCVFVAPAGGTSFTGKKLSPGDLRESLPYALAGFIVVAYEVDGELDVRSGTIEDAIESFGHYKTAGAGLVNATNALNFALAKIPQIDPNHLYTVGHSSAGRQALLWAAHESRLKGVAAFAPEVAMQDSELAKLVQDLHFMPRSFPSSVRKIMPRTHIQKIRCPVLVVHGAGDAVIPLASSKAFVDDLRAQKTEADLLERETDHFEILGQAVPEAIVWLRRLAKVNESAIRKPDLAGLVSVQRDVGDDLKAAWKMESHLIPLPTNNPIAKRFRFVQPVRDSEYDPRSGKLYVAGSDFGLMEIELDQLLQRERRTLPHFLPNLKEAQRVAVKQLDGKSIIACWAGNSVRLVDAESQGVLGAVDFHFDDQAEEKYRREIVATDDPNDRFVLVNHQGAIFQIDIDTCQAKAIGQQEIQIGMPAWRFFSGLALAKHRLTDQILRGRGVFDWRTLASDPVERLTQFKQLATDAHLAGDSLSAALWNSDQVEKVFTPARLDAVKPTPLVEDLFLVFRNAELGLFVSRDLAGIQSARSGQLLAAEPVNAVRLEKLASARRLRRSESDLSKKIWERSMESFGARPSRDGEAATYDRISEIDASVSEMPSAWGLLSGNPPTYRSSLHSFSRSKDKIEDSSHAIELNERRAGTWAFVDEKRQIAILVTRSDVLLFDVGSVKSPVLAEPPHLLYVDAGEEIDLPVPQGHRIRSLQFDGHDFFPRIKQHQGKQVWVPLPGELGWKRMEWDVDTEAGLEKQFSWICTGIPLSRINHPYQTFITATPQDDTVIVSGGDHQKKSSWTVVGGDGDVILHERRSPHPTAVAVYDDSVYLALTRNWSDRYSLSKGSQSRQKLEFEHPVSSYRRVGDLVVGNMRYPGKKGFVDVSVAMQHPKLQSSQPTIIDPFHACRYRYGNQEVWNGVLWRDTSRQQGQLLVDFPKQYEVAPRLRNNTIQFAGHSLYVDEILPHVCLKKPATPKQADPVSSPVRVRKGSYELLLESIDEKWTKPVLVFTPFGEDQNPVRIPIVTEFSKSLITTPIAIAVSKNMVWVQMRYRLFRLRREWFESEIRGPGIDIEPVQSTFELNTHEKQTVRYDVSGGSGFRLYLSQDLEKSFAKLNSTDGTFEIDLSRHLAELRKAIYWQVFGGRGADAKPETLDISSPKFTAWLKRQRQMYRLVRGVETEGIPVEVKALLVVEDDAGEQAGLFHSYIAVLSPRDLKAVVPGE